MIHENPRVEKAGLAWTIMETRNQPTRATKMAAMEASNTR
jgi:hypothetical protein